MGTRYSLPYPFGARPGAAAERDARTTAPGIGMLIGRDDPQSFVLDRPLSLAAGPGSPIGDPRHPLDGKLIGLRLDDRALAKLDAVPRIAPRITLSIAEQERNRGMRGVVTRLRTPPGTYAVPYNASPLGPGTAVSRPLPGMDTRPPGTLPQVDF